MVSEIVQAGVVPGAIEMMDKLAIEAAEEMAHAGYPVGRAAALLVELDGAERECEARFDEVVEICERCGSDDVRVAKDEAERQLFWKTRKAAFPAMGRIAPNYFVQDGVIPRTKLPEVLERLDELAEEYGMQVANVFHAGDGNLHPLVCYDGRKEGEAERAEELSGRILDACLEAGGSITGEHGVGVDKKKHMPKMFDEPDLATFQRLRCAFDPDGLANPGKVMPTPRLCGEVPGPTGCTRWKPPGSPRGSERGDDAEQVTTERPGSPEEAAELLRSLGEAGSAVRPLGGGTKRDWGGAASRSPSSSDRRDGEDPRAQRGRPDRGAAGRRAARRGAGRRSPRPTRCSRSTRRSEPVTPRRSAASSRPPTRARCATATAACATSCSASRSCCPTARSPRRAAR